MATIKDIAREAGVSHGTVSNVLNRTGKVSSDKIARVEAAAKRLGYRANIQAQILKSGHGKKVALVLPSIDVRQWFSFYDSLRYELSDALIDLKLYVTDDIEQIEKNCLARIEEDRPSLIIACSSLEDTVFYPEDIPAVFIDRLPQHRREIHFFAGFSHYNAGADIGRYLMKRNRQKIAVFGSSERHYDYRMFSMGLNDVCGTRCSSTFYGSDFRFIMGTAVQLSSEAGRFDAIIAMDNNRAEALRKANRYTRTSGFPEILSLSDNTMFGDDGFVQYRMDYRKLGHIVARMSVAFIDEGNGLKDIRLNNSGFQEQLHFSRNEGDALRLLALESPASDALLRLVPEFRRSTGIDVEIDCLPYDRLYNAVKEGEGIDRYDLVRVDMAWLPEIAESRLMPIDTESPEYRTITESFIPELGDEYSKVGGKTYALPFDPSVQILFYNQDAFNNSMMKRLYYEKYRKQLAVPENFTEHDLIAEFFTKRLNPGSSFEYGTTVTCGSPGVAACDFLPRLTQDMASLDFHSLISDGSLLDALQAYARSYGYTEESSNMWWQAAIKSFSSGSTAMLTVFMNHASTMSNSRYSRIIGKVGFAQVPGGRPLLGGGSIGMTRNCKRTESAIQFLKWVYSDEIARLLTYFGGLSPNSVVFDDMEILRIYPWLSIAREGFKRGLRRFSSAEDASKQKALEDVLGSAVRDVVIGKMSPSDAIEKVRTINFYC